MCMRRKCIYMRSPTRNKIVPGAWTWWISMFEFDDMEEYGYKGQYCHLACINEGWIHANLAKFPLEAPQVGLVTLEEAEEHFREYIPRINQLKDECGDDVVNDVIAWLVEMVRHCIDEKLVELVPVHKNHTRRRWTGFATIEALDRGLIGLQALDNEPRDDDAPRKPDRPPSGGPSTAPKPRKQQGQQGMRQFMTGASTSKASTSKAKM